MIDVSPGGVKKGKINPWIGDNTSFSRGTKRPDINIQKKIWRIRPRWKNFWENGYALSKKNSSIGGAPLGTRPFQDWGLMDPPLYLITIQLWPFWGIFAQLT